MRWALLLLFVGAVLSGCGGASTAASPTTPPSYRASVLADHPVAYWRLDEETGTVLVDASGNGNDGTYAGAVTLGQPGALASDSDTAAGVGPAGGAANVPRTASLPGNPVTDDILIN